MLFAPLLAILAGQQSVLAQDSDSSYDEPYSPPYPYPTYTPQSYSPAWTEAHAAASARLATWSVEQKTTLVTGVGFGVGRCVGNIAAVPEQNFTGLCLQDSPLGVRLADFVSVFPAGINAAAT